MNNREKTALRRLVEAERGRIRAAGVVRRLVLEAVERLDGDSLSPPGAVREEVRQSEE